MSSANVPILLSFYGLSNGKQNMFFGKLAYSPTGDLSFKNYNRLKTFRTIIALYRTRAIKHREFEINFDHGNVKGVTDESGSFWCEIDMDERQTKLQSLTLTDTGENILLTEDLYPNIIQSIRSNTIVISDLDDTLIHSFINNKIKQITTLLLTSVEKRKAVTTMVNLLKRFSVTGAVPFYVSNSEQNLYPMLFRFLSINEFPTGPLFLKQYIRFQHMVKQRLLGIKNIHKHTVLQKIFKLFSDKKYILIGDNTQHDLAIYLDIATQYPQNIRYIIIREVVKTTMNQLELQHARETLKQLNIPLFYDTHFPDDLPWELE